MSISVTAREIGYEPHQRVGGDVRITWSVPSRGPLPAPGTSVAKAGMQAGYVGGCFGWLHAPDAACPTAGCDVAVLLCPALGWDGLHAHHGFRLLADQLAACGYPALRIQYPGTGDSSDLPGNDAAEPWACWQRCVQDAADWLKANTGARRLILVGLRFGATLATAVAADRADVASLVLLAPVLRGKSYIRQLDMEARLEGGASAEAPASDGGIDLHELRFGPETVRLISELDLRRAKIRAGVRVAIVPQAPSQIVDSCAQAWTAAGLHVECLGFDGLEPLLQEAIHSDPLPPEFSRVLEWVGRAVPPAAAEADRAAPGLAPSLEFDCCTETPVRFGPGGRLFGVLCRASTGPVRQAVIIGNTGRDPHYGIARFGVELARRLAAEGIVSLRMDFAGLGDSVGPVGHEDRLSSLFETDRTADIGAAIDVLASLGCTEFAVQGLCSGAYHAFRAALRDRRIGSLLLVNLPVFDWHGGDTVRQAIWTAAPTRRILQKLLDPATWRRALAGQAEIRPFVQAQGRRLLDLARRWLPVLAPASSQPERAVGGLSGRGVRSLYLYSAGDPGLDVLETAFGLGGEHLQTQPGVAVQVVPGIDHVLSGRRMRAEVANVMVTFLAAQEGRRTAHDDPLDHSRPDGHSRPPAEADARTPAR